jgi:hypothetical protein
VRVDLDWVVLVRLVLGVARLVEVVWRVRGEVGQALGGVMCWDLQVKDPQRMHVQSGLGARRWG